MRGRSAGRRDGARICRRRRRRGHRRPESGRRQRPGRRGPETGRKALAVRADVAKKADIQNALRETLDTFGRVDILLNAAGINSGTPFFEIERTEWQRIIDINLKSVFLACQVFGKAMVDAGHGGSIINISSASSGPPLSKVFTYSVTKGGVNQITQFLAREFGAAQRAGECHPARVLPRRAEPQDSHRRTRRADHGPHADEAVRRASELVGAAIYLASDEASFVRDRLDPARGRRIHGDDDLKPVGQTRGLRRPLRPSEGPNCHPAAGCHPIRASQKYLKFLAAVSDQRSAFSFCMSAVSMRFSSVARGASSS